MGLLVRIKEALEIANHYRVQVEAYLDGRQAWPAPYSSEKSDAAESVITLRAA